MTKFVVYLGDMEVKVANCMNVTLFVSRLAQVLRIDPKNILMDRFLADGCVGNEISNIFDVKLLGSYRGTSAALGKSTHPDAESAKLTFFLLSLVFTNDDRGEQSNIASQQLDYFRLLPQQSFHASKYVRSVCR